MDRRSIAGLVVASFIFAHAQGCFVVPGFTFIPGFLPAPSQQSLYNCFVYPAGSNVNIIASSQYINCTGTTSCNAFLVFPNANNSFPLAGCNQGDNVFPLGTDTFRSDPCFGTYVRDTLVPPPPLPPSPPYPPPRPPPPPPILPPSKSSSSVGPIVGGVIGGLVILALLGALGWWMYRRRTRNNHNVPHAAMPPYDPSGPHVSINLLGGGAHKGAGTWYGNPAPNAMLAETAGTAKLRNNNDSSSSSMLQQPLQQSGQPPRQLPGFDGVSVSRSGQPPSTSNSGVQASGTSAARVGTSWAMTDTAAATPGVQASVTYQAEVLNRLRIPWESIEIGEVLGKGGFGTVNKGLWQGNKVAVKMLNPEKLSVHAQDALRQEALAMCELRHPCIAQVYGLVDDGAHRAIVMRYYRRGSVAAAMANMRYMDIDTLQRLRMAMQVASGMCCLHERNILHGDLKTANLLIEDANLNVVIADFGLSCMTGQAVASGALTLSISPPEVLENPQAPRTAAGDVYAFGIVLMEMVSGRFAYQNFRPEQLRAAVMAGRRPAIPAAFPEDAAEIITACWAQDPAARPTFAQVVTSLEAAARAHAAGNQGSAYDTTAQTGAWF